MSNRLQRYLSRRKFLGFGLRSIIGMIGTTPLRHSAVAQDDTQTTYMPLRSSHDGTMMMVGEVDHERNGFDPLQILTDWDYGAVSELSNGQTLREYTINAADVEIEIAPGIFFPAWVYNGRVPGPTIRCTEGDRIRIHFRNFGSHPHTIHFHGVHPFEMDGVIGAGDG